MKRRHRPLAPTPHLALAVALALAFLGSSGCAGRPGRASGDAATFPPSSASQTISPPAAAESPPPALQREQLHALRKHLDQRSEDGDASESELRLLKALCKAQRDDACRDRTTALLRKRGFDAAVSTSGAPDAGKTQELADDETKLRARIEARIEAGTHSKDDLRFLKAICAHQRDLPCRDRAAELLQCHPDDHD